MSEVVINLPNAFFIRIIKELTDAKLFGKNRIGEVHIAGSWNNWLASKTEGKAGHIKPTDESQLTPMADWQSSLELSLEQGLYTFKPVVITTAADADGFHRGTWLPCPQHGFHPYWNDGGKHSNWKFVVFE